MNLDLRSLGGVLGLIIAVWLVYLTIKLAQFLDAWPFS
jgi:hypothetical protein